MNKEEVVKQIFKYIESTKDFILEESPQLFIQIVNYGRVLYGSCIILSIFGLIFGLIFLFKNLKKIKYDCYGNLQPGCVDNFFIVVIVLIMSLFSLIIFITCFSDAIKSIVSPKLYIIDYLLKR